MKTVIVDIDGTLTMVGDRAECLKQNPPDWDSFYARCSEDLPVREMIDLVNVLSMKYHVVLCTGRRESCRKDTVKWLCDNGVKAAHVSLILMRKDGDFRQDSIVKQSLLKMAEIEKEDIAFVLEDRASMVAHWRSLGIMCLQVAEGKF